jgi:hypothetical protein
LLCPVGQHFIVALLREACQPLRAFSACNHDNIGYIAGAKATTDRKMHMFEQAPVFPLLLEPLEGNLEIAFSDLAAAAAVAHADLRQHGMLNQDSNKSFFLHNLLLFANAKSFLSACNSVCLLAFPNKISDNVL